MDFSFTTITFDCYGTLIDREAGLRFVVPLLTDKACLTLPS
jgi:FMN phosphatase YigB (HAD superfamily)